MTAFKLLVTEMVPKVAYVTLADGYIMACFLTVILTIGEIWYVATFFDESSEAQIRADRSLELWSFLFFVAWNLCFAVAILRHLARRGSETSRRLSIKQDAEAVHLGPLRVMNWRQFAESTGRGSWARRLRESWRGTMAA